MSIVKDYKQYKKELKQGVRFFDTHKFTGGVYFSQVYLAMDLRRLNVDSGHFIFTYK
jgi:hypothetical protein